MRRAVRILCFAAATGALAACQSAAPKAPDFINHAMGGEYDAQIRLAGCYSQGASCIGVRADPALACAWRGVILASGSAELSLADADAYRTACDNKDETFRQRAGVAREELFRRIYRTSLPSIEPALAANGRALYPSAETIRRRVSLSLATMHEHPLPRFGPQNLVGGAKRVLTWRSCTEKACFDAASPAVGGGVVSYRVSVAGPNSASAASRLAAAGLDAPGLDTVLQAGGPRKVDTGPVCWTISAADDRGSSVTAELGPCRTS